MKPAPPVMSMLDKRLAFRVDAGRRARPVLLEIDPGPGCAS